MKNELIKRFLKHLTGASIVLLIILLIGELFIPGLVLPFFDLIDFAVLVTGLLIVDVLAM